MTGGSSFVEGKGEVCAWIRREFSPEASVLDVGPGRGTWRKLLPEYGMDAVEIFKPTADALEGYAAVYNEDIRKFHYDWYDLIIFGDVIEHLTPEDALWVLEFAKPRCRDMVVAVPFLYPQGEEYGNPYEAHIQDDLTAEIFAERVPGLAVLHDTGIGYCYYHKGDEA